MTVKTDKKRNPERDASGKFVAKAGPGRKKLTEAQRQGKEMLKRLLPEAVAVIGALLQSDDPEIQIKAAKIVIDKLVESPKQVTELTGADGAPCIFQWQEKDKS